MPSIHPREKLVNKAEREIENTISNILEKHDLTVAEELRVLAAVLGNRIGMTAKFMIREERHGDTDKPGGLK